MSCRFQPTGQPYHLTIQHPAIPQTVNPEGCLLKQPTAPHNQLCNRQGHRDCSSHNQLRNRQGHRNLRPPQRAGRFRVCSSSNRRAGRIRAQRAVQLFQRQLRHRHRSLRWQSSRSPMRRSQDRSPMRRSQDLQHTARRVRLTLPT